MKHIGRGRIIPVSTSALTTWSTKISWVAKAAWPGPPSEEAITANLDFMFPLPSKATKEVKRRLSDGMLWRPARPDIDKLARAVLDALTGIVWVDDDQVVELVCRKRWWVEGGVRIQVATAEGSSWKST